METNPLMTMTVLDRALVAGDAGQVTGERHERPDPEVPERARRRTFTAQYKLDVVAEYDAAPTGEKGAVLRQEGLYSSHVIEWRRPGTPGRSRGAARPGGRPAADPRDAQIARLQKEKARLEQELAKARFVVDVQSSLKERCRVKEGFGGVAVLPGMSDWRLPFPGSCQCLWFAAGRVKDRAEPGRRAAPEASLR
jgi:transposase-like protein